MIESPHCHRNPRKPNKAEETAEPPKKKANDTRVSIFNSDFCDFIRKTEILRAIDDCGFEYPYKIQYKFMPQAVAGMDILCQSQSGNGLLIMTPTLQLSLRHFLCSNHSNFVFFIVVGPETGKATGFVLATLQQVKPTENHVSVVVICNTRVRAFHIRKKYEHFAAYMPALNVAALIGGLPVKRDEELLKTMKPHIVVGTPGRILALVRSKRLDVKRLKHVVVDDCGTTLEQLDMRRDILEIFRNTPSEKQVMMFATSLDIEIRAICRKLMQFDAIEIL